MHRLFLTWAVQSGPLLKIPQALVTQELVHNTRVGPKKMWFKLSSAFLSRHSHWVQGLSHTYPCFGWILIYSCQVSGLDYSVRRTIRVFKLWLIWDSLKQESSSWVSQSIRVFLHQEAGGLRKPRSQGTKTRCKTMPRVWWWCKSKMRVRFFFSK